MMMMILVVRWVIFISCIFISSIHAATDPDDVSALKVMYTSLNSPSQLTKWTSNGGDPCGESWMGIVCTGSNVTEIKISGLGLTGSMGYQLANLKSVIHLDMSNNNLGNQLPYQLPPNLQRLHLGGNSFNGALPYSISMMKALNYLNVSHNQFNLQLNDMFQSLSALTTLDLSFNSLPGMLPQSFSLLSSVTTLYLQNNQFTGTINVLANLPLQNLNVANNHFTGWVPEQLKAIIQDNGNTWSSGQAPPPPPGSPPVISSNKNNKPSSNKSPPEDGGAKKSGIGGGAIAGIVISVLVVGAFIAFFLVKKRSRRSIPDEESLDNQSFAPLVLSEAQKMKTVQTLSVVGTKTFDAHASINLKPPPFDRHKSFDDEEFINKPVTKKVNTTPIDALSYSIADLQMATGSFSVENLIGEGSFGRVYRAQFDDGMVFAVKKINPSILPHSADFTEIVSNMSQLHHPNVTELVGYCSEHGQHLLVHEFHNNGSLYEYLHLPDEQNNTLIWNTRVKIALGTARALEYLHEICSPPVVHKNFKSANILLGVELNPHLTDCGLASFLPNADQALIQDAGSGTSAPEVAMSGQYSIKSDVYSFGVVMLELLTGRKPYDSLRPRAEQSLVRWASPQLHDIDALTEMVDPALKGLYPVKSLSRFADVIARCVQIEPEFRPPMSEVVESLVLLVQRANMSRRTNGSEQGSAQQMGSPDYDYMR